MLVEAAEAGVSTRQLLQMKGSPAFTGEEELGIDRELVRIPQPRM